MKRDTIIRAIRAAVVKSQNAHEEAMSHMEVRDKAVIAANLNGLPLSSEDFKVSFDNPKKPKCEMKDKKLYKSNSELLSPIIRNWEQALEKFAVVRHEYERIDRLKMRLEEIDSADK